MNKNIYDDFNKLNIGYFEKVKKFLYDPLGINMSNDVKWIKLNKKWNSSDFPVVIAGTGQPILFLHGFDSSFLEFRRIYPFCLLYTSPSPRDATLSRMPSSA